MRQIFTQFRKDQSFSRLSATLAFRRNREARKEDFSLQNSNGRKVLHVGRRAGVRRMSELDFGLFARFESLLSVIRLRRRKQSGDTVEQARQFSLRQNQPADRLRILSCHWLTLKLNPRFLIFQRTKQSSTMPPSILFAFRKGLSARRPPPPYP